MKQHTKLTILLVLGVLALLALFTAAFGQGRLYEGPDDAAGDIAAEREGYMTGNRVFLYFQNTTELSDWPRVDVSRWPNNYEGTKMTDGINLLVNSMVFLENDTIPVTDRNEIESRSDLDTLWYCETSFRGGMDNDPTGTIQWGYYPVFGYFNDLDEYPAMSNRPGSWPIEGWPARGDEIKWAGEWNGRFGLGVMYADLETFMVVNDAHDQEYLEDTDTTKYYPRPGVLIGDKKSDVTIQKGLPWGGLGTRVEARGYQWNNPLVRDVIFWEYNITNISDYDLPYVGFGFHVDNAIGNDANDEIGYFDTFLDLAYSWDIDGVGQGGVHPGVMGFAFLESPGIAFDGDDNDQDGLIDEARDNQANQLLGPTEGIDDLDDFLYFYGLDAGELSDHWDADEDGDWTDGFDANGDGIYQITEDAGDDVGLDGVGPTELQYPGPDADGSEGNHKPDFAEGLGSEPDFAATDVSESDMMGLTSFTLFPVQEQYFGRPMTFHSDWVMYELVATGILDPWIGEISNLIEVFGSGPFPLYKGRTERLSMAMLHSYEELSGLNQDVPEAPVMFEQKRVVQMIYERDYRFAQPPKLPTLKATAYDGKVVLTWDNIADIASREPFLGGKNDFEGYKLYRATDKKFQDAESVTDGFGTPSFMKPIFQCDKKDLKIGFTDFGLLNGMGYYLGNDSGVQHYFVDETVQNGKTYYYGLAAYDYGIPDSLIEIGIAPSENNVYIELDESENIYFVPQNVQAVTPHQMASGYVPPELEILAEKINPNSGTISPEIVSRDELKPGHTYTVKFDIDTVTNIKNMYPAIRYTAAGYRVWDVTDSTIQVLVENQKNFIGSNLVYDNISLDPDGSDKHWLMPINMPIISDQFDGIRLNIKSNIITALHSGYDYEKSGWVIGNSNIYVAIDTSALEFFPWDYELIFTNNPAIYTGKESKASALMKTEEGIRIDKSEILTQQSADFFMINKDMLNANGVPDTLDFVVWDLNLNGTYDKFEDKILFGAIDDRSKWKKSLFYLQLSADSEPQPGDVYRTTFYRPFFLNDSLTFKVNPAGALDKEDIRNSMDDIKVVPNPYVATNSMEASVANWNLNQKRRIMFTHLPARCTIKIFTASGVFVDELIVENGAADGTAHWDMVTDEGLEIAAGMYIYHVQAEDINAEKIGKFGVIK